MINQSLFKETAEEAAFVLILLLLPMVYVLLVLKIVLVEHIGAHVLHAYVRILRRLGTWMRAPLVVYRFFANIHVTVGDYPLRLVIKLLILLLSPLRLAVYLRMWSPLVVLYGFNLLLTLIRSTKATKGRIPSS
jgi:hypothetical protein